jgi:NtrC-family two-component system sensor histidine kinase KinB
MKKETIEFTTLPPVRKNVFKHSLLLVAVYVVVGVFMMIAVFLASGITPKAIHVNYDSIAASDQMREAWNAIKNPEQYPEHSFLEWKTQFDHALTFEETNLTEPGEAEATNRIKKIWSENNFLTSPTNEIFESVRRDLNQVTAVNEKGMFAWVERSHAFSRRVFFVTVILFLLTILIALYLADSLAIRIATPLRELAAMLKEKPMPGLKLKIPTPDTLEMRILTQSLTEFWEKISYFQTLNLDEISAQKNKLEAVLTSVEDAILVLDTENRIIHYNPGFAAIIPVLHENVLGSLWFDLPTASDNYLTLRSRLMPNVSHEQSLELEVGSKKRIFAARYRPIHDTKNQSIGNLYLLHDITETKQRELLRAEFIGVLSHELKTPLQSLGTASELLEVRKDKFTGDEKMLIETIAEDTQRIKNVVNEFVEAGVSNLYSLRLKIEAVPIQKLILQWMQPVQVMAKERDVQIELAQTIADDVLVKIDKVKFSWAIANLLSNALRVSPPNTTIQVSLKIEDHYAIIEVADQGPGIPEDVQRRMFEPYFQAKAIDGVKTGGFLGLGLTITKDVVEAHSGKIEYFARKPVGSIFRITIPMVIG